MGSETKDVWDRITALASILVPAAIALAGHFIAQGLKQAEISNEQVRAQQSRVIAEANTKIAQAELINTMMKSLTSENPQERKLAVEAVLIALPEQGPVLVRTIARSDTDVAVQAAARNSLEQRADALIRDLFASEPVVRIAAAGELIRSWRDDANVVAAMAEFADRNRGNADGVYNTVVVLAEFTPRALREQSQAVRKVIEIADGTGEKTRTKAALLERKMGG